MTNITTIEHKTTSSNHSSCTPGKAALGVARMRDGAKEESQLEPSIATAADNYTPYFIGDRRVSEAEAAYHKEEYGEYWLTAKRKERLLCRRMKATGRSGAVARVKLMAFQTFVHLEALFGEDWPPLIEANKAIARETRRHGSVAGLRMLSQCEDRLDCLGRRTDLRPVDGRSSHRAAPITRYTPEGCNQ